MFLYRHLEPQLLIYVASFVSCRAVSNSLSVSDVVTGFIKVKATQALAGGAAGPGGRRACVRL
jgi:hypothetical protein